MSADDFSTPPPSEATKTSETFSDRGEGDDGLFGEGDEGASEKKTVENDEEEDEESAQMLAVEEPPEEEEEEDEDFHHDTNEYISAPYLSPNCTLSEDILQFDYSYGYDCQKLFNLCVIDKVQLIFSSGNLIHCFNTAAGKKWFRRSYSGCGIGHITKNPMLPHIAVGEKGENPLIIIYEWPSFEIVSILRGGTKTGFTFLNYNPDGELLCSQGDRPDYTITIWNWRKQKIILRSKAYGQTVFNSRFSLYVPGHLTSSGISHVKFWKMNRTFTGLKLLGELGRFGKSEICNIIGFLALPDEKVVTGSEWGNILVWDGGLIRVEVFRRGKNFCHDAPITQFIYNNGDLTTVAMDGTIKVWYYETIELADPPEEDRFIEVEPILEIEVGDYYHKAKLLVIVKADEENPDDHFWYGQDGNGGIWKIELSASLNANAPTMVLQCHAGAVTAIQASPFSPHLASLGDDGRLLVYDVKQKILILKKEFLPAGCSLLWLPLQVEDSGCVLIGGFADGAIRVLVVSLTEFANKISSPTEEYINLIQVTKPHTKPVTVITINPKHTIVVTGSEDETIFVFQIAEGKQFVKLLPIGYVSVPGEVTHCTWKPKKEATLLVSCKNGKIMEVALPQEAPSTDPVSYELDSLPKKTQTFVSIKSGVRREQRLQEILAEREQILAKKREELAEKAEASGTEVDETIIEALQEELEAEEPELPELYIPKIPNPVLFATYMGKHIWMSMGGFDAGYLYMYNLQGEGPEFYEMIPDGDDMEISTYHYYFNNDYLILGMNDGRIRIVKLDESHPSNLSDYWSLSMHDNDNGTIRQICFNYNYSTMFTCGNDGNIFSYFFKPEDDEYKRPSLDILQAKGFPLEICPDIDDFEMPSLEQAKNRIEHDEKMKEANVYKRELTEILKGMEKKFEGLLRRNAKLPLSQQLTPADLILDERIEENLAEYLEKEMEDVKFKLAWSVEKSRLQHEKVNDYFLKKLENHVIRVYGINDTDIFAETFKLCELGQEFDQLNQLVLLKLEEQEAKGRAQARLFSEEEIVDTIVRRPNPVEGLIKQIMVICGDYEKNIKLRRLLRKYKERKDRLETRRIEWYEMMKKKPNPEKPDPADVASIELAKETIGDYQLKTAPDYKVPKNARVTTVHVYDQLLKTKQRIYEIKKEYNTRVLRLREKKQEMIDRHEYLRDILLEIAKEIPKEKIRHPPKLPTYNENVEFPEKKFEHNQSGVLDELPKRYKTIFKAENLKKKELKLLDKEYEMLILEKKGVKMEVGSRLAIMKYAGITGSVDMEKLQEAGKDDQVITPWEKECKKLRVIKRLYEQDGIIDEMDTDIREFDEEIIELNERKYQIQVDLEFLELYLLTLHQEVLILKKFEAAETEKENRLFEKLREKHDTQKKMNEINSRVEGRNREIRKCEEEIKNLVTMFHSTTADNKFYDFLKRIFKKKYRPPKVKSEDSDSESESESSSSSEEEDAKSLDSKDLGPLRLDETVCPAGCDPVLYEWTFTQRAARHALELNIMEEKKQIDIQKKEYEGLLKKIKATEVQYLACKEDLEEYIREKQRNLNEVETVVVLRLNQIQNFKSDSEIEKISESVLFPSSKLTSLYKRIGELEKETQMEKQKHEKNRQHLTRMKIDINHMKEMIQNLTKEIGEVMLRKFGTKVNMDDIEESLLKKLVAEMHSIILDLEKSFSKKLQTVRARVIERENEYARKLQDNTEKYNLITVLQEQKAKIQQTIHRQDKWLCLEKDTSEYDEDVEKLEKIYKMQQNKIDELRAEIALLKLKTKPKPPRLDDGRPELIQRVRIKMCNGEVEEMEESCKETVEGMYQEAQEIVRDIREGEETSEEDQARMRKLTGDMIRMLPEKCRENVIRRLSKGIIVEEPMSDRCAEGILTEIVKSMSTDSFVEAMTIVKEILDSVFTQFENEAFKDSPTN